MSDYFKFGSAIQEMFVIFLALGAVLFSRVELFGQFWKRVLRTFV